MSIYRVKNSIFLYYSHLDRRRKNGCGADSLHSVEVGGSSRARGGNWPECKASVTDARVRNGAASQQPRPRLNGQMSPATAPRFLVKDHNVAVCRPPQLHSMINTAGEYRFADGGHRNRLWCTTGQRTTGRGRQSGIRCRCFFRRSFCRWGRTAHEPERDGAAGIPIGFRAEQMTAAESC